MAGTRRKIPAATEAALWALSNGHCYAPGCSAPVVVEVRPGAYRKNAQIAHIRGVRAPRHDPALTEAECAAFSNLLVLRLPHHGEVDDRKTGETLYPPPVLLQWKADHEGANGPALAALGPVSEETLTSLLLSVFSPPVKRLQQIADQLEQTGTLNADTVAQLRQIVRVMDTAPARTDMFTAEMLADAAAVFGNSSFHNDVEELMDIAAILSPQKLDATISGLHDAADALSAAAQRIERRSGDW